MKYISYIALNELQRFKFHRQLFGLRNRRELAKERQ